MWKKCDAIEKTTSHNMNSAVEVLKQVGLGDYSESFYVECCSCDSLLYKPQIVSKCSCNFFLKIGAKPSTTQQYFCAENININADLTLNSA